MGGCLGCFGRSDLSPVDSGRSTVAVATPLPDGRCAKLGDRRHAHMSSSDAEFQRKRPAGEPLPKFLCQNRDLLPSGASVDDIIGVLRWDLRKRTI